MYRIATSETIPRPPLDIRSLALTADDLLNRIHNHDVFTLSRWGDGEWYCMFGEHGANSDGQPYHAALGTALREVLTSRPRYLLGMRFPDQDELQLGIPRWLRRNHLTDLQWYNAGLIWHDLSVTGEINRLCKAFNSLPLMLVGPSHLNTLVHCNMLDALSQIIVPLVDAWKRVDLIEQDVLNMYNMMKAAKDDDLPFIISFSCGITAKPLIDRLHKKIGQEAFLIDTGSVWDPYCGVQSRRYHNHPEFRKTLNSVLGIRSC